MTGGPIPEDFDDASFISALELGSDGSAPIFTGVSVVSTVSSSKEITLTGVDLFRDEQLEPGDLITLAGTGTADGAYTVNEVTGIDRFTVNEAIANSAGGTCDAKHPAGAKRIGIDTSAFACTNAAELQQALSDIDQIAGEAGVIDDNVPGEVINVPARRQMVVHEELVIEEELRLEGRLFLEE